jgi:hypothetical protein
MDSETKKTTTEPKKPTRTDIQRLIGPHLLDALTGEHIDVEDPDVARRFLRACVHLASARLYGLGLPPQVALAECVEAVIKEAKRFAQQANVGLAPLPFGPKPVGKA